jgi:hypothetical protein
MNSIEKTKFRMRVRELLEKLPYYNYDSVRDTYSFEGRLNWITIKFSHTKIELSVCREFIAGDEFEPKSDNHVDAYVEFTKWLRKYL